MSVYKELDLLISVDIKMIDTIHYLLQLYKADNTLAQISLSNKDKVWALYLIIYYLQLTITELSTR